MGKKWRWFTIMIVPHNEESIFSIRLPLAAIQTAAILFIVAIVALLNFTFTYRQRLHEANEARALRETNRAQQEKIELFESQTLVLKQQVDEMEQVAEILFDRLGIFLDKGEAPAG